MSRMRTFDCCFVVYIILCFVKPLYGDEIKAQDSALAVLRRDDVDGASQGDQVPLDDNQRSPKLTDKDPGVNLQSSAGHAEEINRFVSRFHPKTKILALASMQFN